MDEVSVYVEVEINPTESEEKVKRAVENIFGNIQTKTQPSYKGSLLTAEARGLEALTKLYNLLRRERIRDAARGVLFKGLGGKTISFCLNKQVAYAGHISFSEEMAESPLGPIKVKIECDNPRELIDWLAPKSG
ncbi:MAG: RNA-binding domain-containing protein [Candidatus Bathyarchaeia archaeon]|nr:RNA-binding domain-containing protein [Candidatus Bathyarchaeia archaeon]